MKTANSFKISANCWQLSVKAVMTQMLITVLVVALCFLLFSDLVSVIANLLESLNLVAFFSSTIERIIEGNFNGLEFAVELETLLNDISSAIESVPNIFNRIEASYIGAVLLLCLYRMLNSSADITVAYSLNEFMTTNAKRPFIWYFFKKMSKSLKFVVLQFLTTLPLDLIVAFSIGGFYLMFLVPLGRWTVIPVVLIAIGLYSARVAIFAFWLPSIAANDSGVIDGMKNGFSKLPGHFWSNFLQIFVTIIIVASSVFASYYFLPIQYGTIISSVVLFAGFFLIKCFNIVQYFEANQIPYFTVRVNLAGAGNKKNRRSKTML